MTPPHGPVVVACVNVGDYCGRGEEYVAKLRAGVERHLQQPFGFHCIRTSRRAGWWAKLDLFKPGAFAAGTRIVYLDLDTLIVGPLEPLVASKGILHLGLWGWQRNDYGSGIMVWDAGEHTEVWTECPFDVQRRFRGDQDWLTRLGGWPALPLGLCVSYKYHCAKRSGPPPGASVVCFHGPQKPHNVKAAWAAALWNGHGHR